MSRKPQKGYFVRGQFVAEGSELDLQLKTEQKGAEISKTDLKRESAELQKLGEALVDLRPDLREGLQLSDKLSDALDEARRIHNFEGRRRHLQYVGKLMRGLEPDQIEAARLALSAQHSGTAKATEVLHRAEAWRDELLLDDSAFTRWMAEFPQSDAQQLRALLRQARKDHQPTRTEQSEGRAPRHGRAYRELFHLIRGALAEPDSPVAPANAPDV